MYRVEDKAKRRKGWKGSKSRPTSNYKMTMTNIKPSSVRGLRASPPRFLQLTPGMCLRQPYKDSWRCIPKVSYLSLRSTSVTILLNRSTTCFCHVAISISFFKLFAPYTHKLHTRYIYIQRHDTQYKSKRIFYSDL